MQAELCEPFILTFDAFWLWLVQRVSRFAGSLALGHRVWNLLLLWCWVPCFAELWLWSWALRTGGRKLATAKKNNLVSLFERMDLFICLCCNDLYVSLYMPIKLRHRSSQDKAKKDAGASQIIPRNILAVEREREIVLTCQVLRSQWN